MRPFLVPLCQFHPKMHFLKKYVLRKKCWDAKFNVLQALRQFRRMCNEPYVPKAIDSTTTASRVSEVATYTSPFGEEEPKPQTRAKSRSNHPRTPYVQSAPQIHHIKRPRSRRIQPQEADQQQQQQQSSVPMFLSLPNTPDTEEADPVRVFRSRAPYLVPGMNHESYLWKWCCFI